VQITTYYFVAFIVGLVAGLYLPLNGRFGEQVGSPVLATAVFFSIGAVTAITVYLIIGDGILCARLKRADLPLYALGIVSFAIILAATYLIPRIGPGAYFICIVRANCESW
jgi:transporter family-2 protein